MQWVNCVLHDKQENSNSMKKILLVLVIAAGLALSSCYKEPENGVAKIKVVTSMVYIQPGATVHLDGPAGSNIHVSGLTDMNGVFEYEHDPALEVILTVTATYGPSSGAGIIRISPDETNSTTITLYP